MVFPFIEYWHPLYARRRTLYSKNGTVKWNSKMAQRFSLLFSLLATSERILELVVRNGAVSPDA